MTTEMQDKAINIASDALFKNNTETDAARDIKKAFEDNTSATSVPASPHAARVVLRAKGAVSQVALFRRAELRLLRDVRGAELHVLLHRPGGHLPLCDRLSGTSVARGRRLSDGDPLFRRPPLCRARRRRGRMERVTPAPFAGRRRAARAPGFY